MKYVIVYEQQLAWESIFCVGTFPRRLVPNPLLLDIHDSLFHDRSRLPPANISHTLLCNTLLVSTDFDISYNCTVLRKATYKVIFKRQAITNRRLSSCSCPYQGTTSRLFDDNCDWLLTRRVRAPVITKLIFHYNSATINWTLTWILKPVRTTRMNELVYNAL